MFKNIKEKIKKIISRHFVLALLIAFVTLPIAFLMIYQSLYNVFAIATALFLVVGGIKLLIWKFGNNIFIKETTLSKKHAEFKKSDAYRTMCLDDAAEAFLLASLALVLAIALQIILIILK